MYDVHVLSQSVILSTANLEMRKLNPKIYSGYAPSQFERTFIVPLSKKKKTIINKGENKNIEPQAFFVLSVSSLSCVGLPSGFIK